MTPEKPARHELWFGNLGYPAERSQQYGRGPEIVREVNEIRHGHNRLRPAGRGFARYPREGPSVTVRYGRRRKIALMFRRLADIGGGVRACLTDCFLTAAAFMRACGPALVLAAGGPNGLRTSFYPEPPVGQSDENDGDRPVLNIGERN